MWVAAFHEYCDCARVNGYPERDINLLKKKFDRFSNKNKKTGGPVCPPSVRRAKHVVRSIVGKSCAKSLAFDADVDIDLTLPNEDYRVRFTPATNNSL